MFRQLFLVQHVPLPSLEHKTHEKWPLLLSVETIEISGRNYLHHQLNISWYLVSDKSASQVRAVRNYGGEAYRRSVAWHEGNNSCQVSFCIEAKTTGNKVVLY